MVCGKCGERVKVGVEFCPKCKAPLLLPALDRDKHGFTRAPCPHCGLHMPEPAEICPYCNKPISNPPKKGAITDPVRKRSRLRKFGAHAGKFNKRSLVIVIILALFIAFILVPKMVRPREEIRLTSSYTEFEEYPALKEYFGVTRIYSPMFAAIGEISCRMTGPYFAASASMTATRAAAAISAPTFSAELYARAFVISPDGNIKWTEEAPVITKEKNLQPDEICAISLSKAWEDENPPQREDTLLLYIYFSGALSGDEDAGNIQTTFISMDEGVLGDFMN